MTSSYAFPALNSPRASTVPGDPLDPYGPGGPLEPSRGPSTATSVLEREETSAATQVSEPGDHERFSHYVRKEKILESAMSGHPVVALCGKVWVPGRDPQRFPVCPACKEIFEGLREPADGDE
ncbi:DUF3039 domain-containing protein [Austwickia sp. TVS 96-490-7B]|uniref:DUF3039 domain-containing protein n=1 Tax=Austwickia sp. TVS 96-490-7B TaxID=2830843 RepID=UPI001C572E26|nr:DUF3039 domain-containing protein [Austwickia sp. TVS 96-490-7B]